MRCREQALACTHGRQGLPLCFSGQKLNKSQCQLLKICTDIWALTAQYSKICTRALGNGWMVLGILFLTKSSLWVWFFFFLPATTKSLV